MNRRQSFLAIIVLSLSTRAAGATGQVSFTPESFKVPIRSISITGFKSVSGTNTPLPGVDKDAGAVSEVYKCDAASEADCVLDLADDAQLAEKARAGKSSLATGQYAGGTFDLCPHDPNIGTGTTPSHAIFVKGKASISGTTYYTTTAANGSVTTDIAKYDYAQITVQTCQATMRFSSVLTVKADEPVTLTIFPLIRNAAWIDLGVHANTTVGNMCAGGTGGGVCLNYPALIPYAGTTGAAVEAYDVYPSSGTAADAFGELSLLFDTAGTLFGGTSTIVTTPTSSPGGGFGQIINSVKKNADGTYALGTVGSNPETEEVGYLTIPTFSRLPTVGATGSVTYQTCGTGKAADATTETSGYSRAK